MLETGSELTPSLWSRAEDSLIVEREYEDNASVASKRKSTRWRCKQDYRRLRGGWKLQWQVPLRGAGSQGPLQPYMSDLRPLGPGKFLARPPRRQGGKSKSARMENILHELQALRYVSLETYSVHQE